MFYHGNLWKSMETYGNLWKPMEIYGNLWKSMEIYGNLWIPSGKRLQKTMERFTIFDG